MLIFITFAGLSAIQKMMKGKVKIYFTLLIAIISVHLQAQTITRIDPPFWWAGMKETTLQLMVFGENAGSLNPVISYSGVELSRVVRTGNPDYLILDLELAPDIKPGKIPIVFEYQREVVTVAEYEIRQRKTGSADRKGFGKEDIIYLIMPDRFSNGNAGNDSVQEMLEGCDRANPDGRHGGDLAGIRQALDALRKLGVTALWLNPVQENNMKKYSYHGYAITDFYRVDPRLGTNEEYAALVEECHDKGMKVIMDMVFNHCGGNHFWIGNLPFPDWIHAFPEFTRSNFRAETAMDPYASDFDRQRMQTGWFDTPMPDLNQHNEYLAAYLIQNSIWWIEFSGLDGIRMDTYPYSYKDFMSVWMQRVLSEYPGFSVVGETWLQKEAHTAFWQDGSPASGNYRSYLRYITDFPFHYALRDALTEPESWTGGLNRLYYVLSQDFIYADPFSNVIFADNHDLTRCFTSYGEDYATFKMAMAILLTTRGIPMIYYGTEYLMTGEEPKGHGLIRQDYPGGQWPAPGTPALTLQQQEAFSFLSKLIEWRKGSEAILHGRLKQFVPQDGIYVYFRYLDRSAVMVIINKNKQETTLDLERFKEVLAPYKEGTEINSGKKVAIGEEMLIPALSPWIIELGPVE